MATPANSPARVNTRKTEVRWAFGELGALLDDLTDDADRDAVSEVLHALDMGVVERVARLVGDAPLRRDLRNVRLILTGMRGRNAGRPDDDPT